jgi:hypothetical protein
MEFKKGNEPIISLNYIPEQHNKVTDKYTLKFNPALSQGTATLKVIYRGFMRDDMVGFYRSYYKENGQKIWMGATQFQQTEARRAFPCFDVRLSIFFNIFRFIDLSKTRNQDSKLFFN